MQTFVYFLDEVRKATPREVADHVAYLRELDACSRLIVCGPFCDAVGGGMVCITAESETSAHATASADPFVAAGCRTFRLREILRATRANGYLLGP
jgi:uncharacterized protein YciI